jgi:isopenicillin-N epimerase
MEAEPVRFFLRESGALLDRARADLGAFVGAPAQDLALVPNATTGVNAVLRSLRLQPGDELLTTDHAYNACLNALQFAADSWGARVVVAQVPFPIGDPSAVVDRVLESVSSRTRLALMDHVTSPTALVFPIERIVRELRSRGVETIVDGAHAPGMLPLGVESIGAAWYAGNCHKWLCAPKGAGFLYVRPDKQPCTHPVVISHGAGTRRTDKSRFRLEFDWTGTQDPTAALCVPEAIRFLNSRLSGGWPQLMDRNRASALHARDRLCEALCVDPPAPDGMIGSMAAVPLVGVPPQRSLAHDAIHPLQAVLLDRYRIEVPIIAFNERLLVRVSMQIYNSAQDIERLVDALTELLARR